MKDSLPASLDALQQLIIRLRAPEGCPWDQKQTLGDLRAYLIEEAHEVAAAIDSGDRAALAEELGDLLFQVVFVGRLAEEEGAFQLTDVVAGIHAKMVERHPHVFGDAKPLTEADSVQRAWERRKLEKDPERSVLAGVPPTLPALTAAYRLTQKAAGVGFDWPDVKPVLDKVREEAAEVEEALADGDQEHAREEVGDLLFAVANLARHLGVDPESALAKGNLKFQRRFKTLEETFRERQQPLQSAGQEAMDEVWEQVKQRERES